MNRLLKTSFLSKMIIFLFLICITGNTRAKWVGFGFDDPWNDGLFKSENLMLAISSFMLDSDKNPHLIIYYDKKYYYARWDGSAWCGLKENQPEEIDFLNDTNDCFVAKLDHENKPHIVFHKREPDNITSLNYIYWDGDKWSAINQMIVDQEKDGYYLYGDLDFALDKENKPHIVYRIVIPPNLAPPSGKMYFYYRYFDNGEWLTLGAGDKDIGVFKEIIEEGYRVGGARILTDSTNMPHILGSLNHGNGYEPPRSTVYTYWDGHEWTGINNSQTKDSLPYSYYDNINQLTPNSNFYIDDIDNIRFSFMTEVDGQPRIIYMEWDGQKFSSLKGDDDFSIEDLGIYKCAYYVDLNDINSINLLSDFGALRYHYWDGDSWSGLCGSNSGPGIKPSNIINDSIGAFQLLDYPSPIIASMFYSNY